MGCTESVNIFKKVKEIGNKNNNACHSFLIRSTKSDIEYAYKTIYVSALNKEEKKHLLNNFEKLKKLNHPNIIVLNYAEYSEDKRIIYEISEYANGGDLQQKFNEQKKKKEYFEENVLIDWFTQICLALQYIHSTEINIIHRDIRPSNIFLIRDNIAKLGYFGVAKSLESGLQYTRTIVSTPQYSAPEILNKKEYSNKADIWSLGVTFYQLIILNYPFEGKNEEMEKNILEGKKIGIPDDCPIGKDFINIINEMLSEKEDERPSAEEILEKGIIKSRMETFLSEKKYDNSKAQNEINKYEKNKKIEKINKDTTILVEEEGEIKEFDFEKINNINDKIKADKAIFDLNRQMTLMSENIKKPRRANSVIIGEK